MPSPPLPEPADHQEPRTPRELLKHYLRDLVYGANDGIITTFAIVAGVEGASLDPFVVLILGAANLLADGFSMGASNFLSIRSQEALRRAEGLGIDEPHALRHGLATFVAFLVAGAIPLIAYMLPATDAADRFLVTAVLTLLALFAVGASRSFVTRVPLLRGGFEMFLVGAVAAAVAYGVGAAVAGLTAGVGLG